MLAKMCVLQEEREEQEREKEERREREEQEREERHKRNSGRDEVCMKNTYTFCSATITGNNI